MGLIQKKATFVLPSTGGLTQPERSPWSEKPKHFSTCFAKSSYSVSSAQYSLAIFKTYYWPNQAKLWPLFLAIWIFWIWQPCCKTLLFKIRCKQEDNVRGELGAGGPGPEAPRGEDREETRETEREWGFKMLQCCQMAKFDPSLFLDFAGLENLIRRSQSSVARWKNFIPYCLWIGLVLRRL